MIEHYQLTEIIEQLRIQKKLSYQKFLTSDETYRIDLHKHLFYARMLSSKESTLYDFIIKKMVDIPIDTYLKNVLQEVLS
jgi:hypothetical protein